MQHCIGGSALWRDVPRAQDVARNEQNTAHVGANAHISGIRWVHMYKTAYGIHYNNITMLALWISLCILESRDIAVYYTHYHGTVYY